MTSVVLRNPIFKKHKITINPKNNLLQLTDLRVQFNPILPEKMKNVTRRNQRNFFILSTKVQITLQSQVLLGCILAKISDQYQSCTGLVIPSGHLEAKCNIALTSSVSKIHDEDKAFVSAINLSDNQFTLYIQSEKAHFEILNESEDNNVSEIDPHLVSLAKMRNSDDFEGELNQLIQDFLFQKTDTPTGRPYPD